MVLERLSALLEAEYACDPGEITMAASLDDLNLTGHERMEIAYFLGDLYGVEIPEDEIRGFDYVEDLVGYIEDRL